MNQIISTSEYRRDLNIYNLKQKEVRERQRDENISLMNIHPDSLAVDYFANVMKKKLQDKRNQGRQGWYNPDLCSVEYLSKLLRDHLDKGDPVDIANFCMMIYMRGGSIK